MSEKSLEIIPPKGYEIDEEKSTFRKIIFKPLSDLYPSTWEEFCKISPIDKDYFINTSSEIVYLDYHNDRDTEKDKCVLPSRKYAEAMLALCQLLQLRDYYNEGWEPNWDDHCEIKYYIYAESGTDLKTLSTYTYTHSILTFKSFDGCMIFYDNFKDLLEKAKIFL